MRGGKRPGAGRPKGSKSQKTVTRAKELARLGEMIGAQITNAFPGDSHAFLIAVYKDPSMPLLLRIDAAKAVIGYEKPKLAAITHSGDQDNPVTQRIEIMVVDADGSHSSIGAAQARAIAQARPI